MKSPLVSVVIPNYNYAHYLREAIDSVLAQTYPNIDVIVVDDGSKDESREVLASYGDSVRTVFQQNEGVSAARNNGVKESSGEFIAFLDADDLWLPEKVEKQVEQFLDNRLLGLVHVGVDEVDEKGKFIFQRLSGLDGNVVEELLMLKRDVVLGGGSGFMVTRRAFDEVCGFDRRLSTSADWDLVYQISSRYPIGFVPEVLVKYRVHGANMHGNVSLMEHDMMLAFDKAFERMTPELSRLQRRAYGGLHQNLAGSYFVAGQYSKFVLHSFQSLIFDPRNMVYFLRLRRNHR